MSPATPKQSGGRALPPIGELRTIPWVGLAADARAQCLPPVGCFGANPIGRSGLFKRASAWIAILRAISRRLPRGL
jgi:hypothetical protein